MSWTALTLVSDSEIGEVEPQATASGAPWGATTWASARAHAKNLVRIWLQRDHTDIVGVADRVIDRWQAEKVWGYTGSVYTDLTSEARDDTEEDLGLATIFATAGTDRLYLGARYAFDGAYVELLDSVNAIASTLTAKYWQGGAGWTSLSATDGTAVSTATFGKSGRITWTQPSTWSRRDLNGVGEEYFWVELSVSAALTAGTAATQALAIRAPDGLKEVTLLLALFYVLNGLAEGTAEPEPWRTKATMYLDMAKELYAQIRVPLDLDLTGAVEPVTEEAEAYPARVRMLRG